MSGANSTVMAGFLLLAPQAATNEQHPAPDRAVVATVLEDLATRPGKDSPVDGIFSPNPLTLHPVPLRYSLTVENVLYRRDRAAWKALSAAEVAALQEAAADVVRRTVEDDSLVFVTGSKHV